MSPATAHTAEVAAPITDPVERRHSAIPGTSAIGWWLIGGGLISSVGGVHLIPSLIDHNGTLRQTMKCTAALATAGAIIILSSSQTFAGGEVYHRTADATSLRACNGKLIEQVQESGNMHGFSFYLQLACMQSDTEASWVLLSGTSCYDPADRPTRCNDRKVRAIPRFIVDENFWKAKETPSATYPMLYNLLKYGVGETCRIGAQSHEINAFYGNRSDINYYWQCDKIIIKDGIDDIKSSKWKMFRLSTSSKSAIEAIKPEELDSTRWPHFVIPENEYLLKLENY